MKKVFLFLTALFLLAFAPSEEVTAQVTLKATFNSSTQAVSGASEVTVTNTGSDTLFTPKLSKGKLAIFVVTFTETSGTSGGSAVLQGSVDGTDYAAIGSAYTVTDVAGVSTTFKVLAVDNAWNFFRIVYTGTGTMVNKMKAKVSLF